VTPACQPAAGIAPARDGGEIVELSEDAEPGERLYNAERDARAPDAASGETDRAELPRVETGPERGEARDLVVAVARRRRVRRTAPVQWPILGMEHRRKRDRIGRAAAGGRDRACVSAWQAATRHGVARSLMDLTGNVADPASRV